MKILNTQMVGAPYPTDNPPDNQLVTMGDLNSSQYGKYVLTESLNDKTLVIDAASLAVNGSNVFTTANGGAGILKSTIPALFKQNEEYIIAISNFTGSIVYNISFCYDYVSGISVGSGQTTVSFEINRSGSDSYSSTNVRFLDCSVQDPNSLFGFNAYQLTGNTVVDNIVIPYGTYVYSIYLKQDILSLNTNNYIAAEYNTNSSTFLAGINSIPNLMIQPSMGQLAVNTLSQPNLVSQLIPGSVFSNNVVYSGQVLVPTRPRGDSTNNAASTAFVQSTSFPPGMIGYFANNAPPNGFLACNGSTQLIVDFPGLFDAIGNTYGGDGVNTFALPDLRGIWVRGYGANVSGDVSGAFGAYQSGAILSHTHTADFSGAPHKHTDAGHTHNNTDMSNSMTYGPLPYAAALTTTHGGPSGGYISNGYADIQNTTASGTVTVNPTGAAENRVANIAMLACIKY